MSFSLVDHTQASSGNGNDVTTSGINTSGANLLVVLASVFTSGTPTVTDSVGGNSNSWTSRTLYTNAAGVSLQLFYCTPTHVGSGHTFTVTATGAFPAIGVQAWSGAAASSPYDTENGHSETGVANSIQPGSVTPGQDDELLVSGLGVNSNDALTPDSGFTVSDQIPKGGAGVGGAMAYLVETTATAKNPTWSFVGTAQALTSNTATFKAASASGNRRRRVIIGSAA